MQKNLKKLCQLLGVGLLVALSSCASLPFGGEEHGLSKEEAKTVLDTLSPQLSDCRSRYFKAKDGTQLVRVEFVVRVDGAVDDARSDSITPITDPRWGSYSKNHELVECVVRVVKGAQFPKPRGGKWVTVNYPFVFQVAQ